MPSSRSLLLSFCLLACLTPAVSAADMRLWTDSTGRNSLRAEFVSFENGKVTLKGENGKTFEIELAKLSASDQTYVKSQGDNPFKESSPSPFMPAGQNAMPSRQSTGGNSQPQKIRVSRNGAEEIQIDPEGGWNYQPSGPLPLGFRPRNLTLPKQANIFEKLSGLALNLNAKKVAFGYTMGGPGQKPTTRIFIGNLTAGKLVTSSPVDGAYRPLALHDDGDHVVVRSDGLGPMEKTQLSIWRISEDDAVIEKEFQPYDDASTAKNEVAWADFASNGELITCSNYGEIIGWNYETCQPEFHTQTSFNATPAFSPDRKVIAYYADKQIILLDIAQRKTLGVLQAPRELSFATLAFSPSGDKIACGDQTSILLWNAKTGQLERDVPLKGIHIGGKVGFPDEDFVLLGNRYLIDIENEIPLWTYNGVDQSIVERGLTLLAANNTTRGGAIYAVNLPHPEARKLLESIVSKPELIAYRAGDPVRLDVSKIPADHQAEVREELTKALGAVRTQVQDSASVTVEASITGPSPRTVHFRRSGEYTVQEYQSKVDILYGGARAWGTSGTNVPFMVTIKRGENLGTKLQEAGSGPSYAVFKSVRFPKIVVKPGQGTNPDRPTLGSSFIDRK